MTNCGQSERLCRPEIAVTILIRESSLQSMSTGAAFKCEVGDMQTILVSEKNDNA